MTDLASSERRHRLNGDEVPQVMAGLRLRLAQLLEERRDPASAETAFKCLYRLETYPRFRPAYPEPVTWRLIRDYLKNGTVI